MLADQLPRVSDVALLRHLHLKLAHAEPEVQKLLNPRHLIGRQPSIVFGDLVSTGNTQINSTLANEGRDICGGQENQRNGQVLDQRNVQSRLSSELNIAASEKVKCGLVEPALCSALRGKR